MIPLYDQVHYRLPGESQRTTPTALAGAAVTTGNPQDTPAGTGQRAPNTRSSEVRYHKSSHLEGRSLAPEAAPETARDDAAGESPGDASVEGEQ